MENVSKQILLLYYVQLPGINAGMTKVSACWPLAKSPSHNCKIFGMSMIGFE